MADLADFVTNFIEKPGGFEHCNVIAGIYWFRNGRSLVAALQTVIEHGRQTKGEYYLVDAYKVMLEQGARFKTQPTIIWLDAGKPDFFGPAPAPARPALRWARPRRCLGAHVPRRRATGDGPVVHLEASQARSGRGGWGGACCSRPT